MEIHAAFAVHIQIKAGEEVPYDLVVENPKQGAVTKKRMVEVYTSDPTLIYGPRGIGMRNICVLEGKQEKVPILIKSRSHGN